MRMRNSISSLCLLLGVVLCSCQSLDSNGATREEKTEALAKLLPAWKPKTLVNQFGQARSVQLFNNLVVDLDQKRLDASSTGQATLLTADGYALTAAHVLSDGDVSILKLKSPRPGKLALTDAGPVYLSPRHPDQPQRVSIADLEPLPIRLITRFRGSDLALVKLPLASRKHFQLTPKPPAKGAALFSYGSNLSGNSSAGRVLGVKSSKSLRPSYTTWQINTSIPLQKGDSGGPVMNSKGHLAGIVSRGRTDLLANRFTSTVAIGISPPALRELIDKDRSEH
jgi:S1-C subfamily serine protease